MSTLLVVNGAENDAEFYIWYQQIQDTVLSNAEVKQDTDISNADETQEGQDTSIIILKKQQILGNTIIDMNGIPQGFKKIIKQSLNLLLDAIQGEMDFYSSERIKHVCYHGFTIECWYEQLILFKC